MVSRVFVALALGAALLPAQIVLRKQVPQQGMDPWQTAMMNAHQAMSKGDYREADRLMEDALAGALQAGPRDPAFVSVIQQVAQYYWGSGLDLKGEEIFRTAIERAMREQATDVEIQLKMALAMQYLNQQREVKAVSALQEIISEIEKRSGADSPELAAVLHQAGWASERTGNLTAAENYFKRAASVRRPQRAPVAIGGIIASIPGGGGFSHIGYFQPPFALASFYQQHRRFAEAEQVYKDAIDRAANTQEKVSALQMYSGLLQERKRFAEAEAVMKRIIELHESSDSPGERNMTQWDRQNLAQMYLNSGNYEEAGKLIDEQVERAKSRPPESGEYFNALIVKTEALVRQNKTSEADAILEEMLRTADDKQPYQKNFAYNKKAEIADRAGNHKVAQQLRETANKAVQTPPQENPNLVWLLFNDAQRELSKGRTAEAVAIVDRALSIGPTTANPFAFCGNLYPVTNIATALVNDKKSAEGDRLIQRTRTIAEQNCMRQSGINYQDPIISYYVGRGLLDEAKRLTDEWEEKVVAVRGPESMAIESILHKRVDIARVENNDADMRSLEQELLTRSESIHGPDSQPTVQQRMNVARSLAARGDFTRAEQLWQTALAGVERLWPGTGMYASALGEVADVYTQVRRWDEAKQYAERALQVARECDEGQVAFYENRLKTIDALKEGKEVPQEEAQVDTPDEQDDTADPGDSVILPPPPPPPLAGSSDAV